MATPPLRAGQDTRSDAAARGRSRPGTAKKGACDGRLILKYLDETGFSLSLPLAYGWRPLGQPLRVPKHWGSAGRLNLIGTLSYANEQLEYELLEGSCKAVNVLAYLEQLALEAEQQGKLTVVVLDNAGFHRARIIQDRRPGWEEKLFYLRFLPPYSPQLNPIEALWRRLKGFLMPRRCYASRDDLKQAVLAALQLLGAVHMVQG